MIFQSTAVNTKIFLKISLSSNQGFIKFLFIKYDEDKVRRTFFYFTFQVVLCVQNGFRVSYSCVHLEESGKINHYQRPVGDLKPAASSETPIFSSEIPILSYETPIFSYETTLFLYQTPYFHMRTIFSHQRPQYSDWRPQYFFFMRPLILIGVSYRDFRATGLTVDATFRILRAT